MKFTSSNPTDLTVDSYSYAESDYDLSYHTIVTEHPYMLKLGLGAFTTGELWAWLTKTDSKDEFINLKLINDINFDKEDGKKDDNIKKAFEYILGTPDPVSIYKDILFEDSSKISAFRKAGRGGEYYDYGVYNWNFDPPPPVNQYSFSTLYFSDFNNKFVNKSISTSGTSIITLEPNDNPDTFISNIIEMNNYVRLKLTINTKQELEEQTNKKDIARYEFITDIKSSKYRCMEWSGIVPFRLTDKIGFECIKNEIVKYKLYLYDYELPKKTARKATFNDLIIVNDQIDAMGRSGKTGFGEDAEPENTINPNKRVASALRVHYDPSTGIITVPKNGKFTISTTVRCTAEFNGKDIGDGTQYSQLKVFSGPVEGRLSKIGRAHV